jgi:molybdenum cofactor cytidylyltransferase
VVVVSGAHAGAVEAALGALPVRTVRNPRWADGLAGSLRIGVEAQPAAADACLVMLCDQPAVGAADLYRLVAAWRAAPARMAAAHYGGAPGVPAIFPRATWPALCQLQGDSGARGLLAAGDVSTVPMPAAAADVDTPADLQRLRDA